MDIGGIIRDVENLGKTIIKHMSKKEMKKVEREIEKWTGDFKDDIENSAKWMIDELGKKEGKKVERAIEKWAGDIKSDVEQWAGDFRWGIEKWAKGIIEELVKKEVKEIEKQVMKWIDEILRKIDHFKQQMENLKQQIKNLQQLIGQFNPTEILRKGVEFVDLVTPDHWCVKIGPLSVTLDGSKVSEIAALVRALQDHDADGLKPFVRKATSVDIEVEGSYFTTTTRAGISWGYSNPAEKIEEIIGLIKKFM